MQNNQGDPDSGPGTGPDRVSDRGPGRAPNRGPATEPATEPATGPDSGDVISIDEFNHASCARSIFNALRDGGAEKIAPDEVIQALADNGLAEGDCRIAETLAALKTQRRKGPMDLRTFTGLLHPNNATLIHRALRGDLIIPDFQTFRFRIGRIFEFAKDYDGGHVADYIPQLARIDPDLFALGVCTVDGQRFWLGDHDESYCVQSTCKPINYAIALDTLGVDVVHRHVGREPSGHGFNALTLNKDDLPHNPMINAGAIMCASLIKPHLPMADRFDYVTKVWRSACGGQKVGFDNAVYHSEKATADRNFALAYFMSEKGAFPPDTDLIATLDFYFQCCSLTTTASQMAVLAGTLANGGICPVTHKRVFSSSTVKNCLSLMYSCGMYDFSGEYAFTVGLPAKSGVSGALFIVVPGVCGFAVWSPRLDRLGNSVRGVEFSRRLVETFAFHTYAGLIEESRLIDPRRTESERGVDSAVHLCAAGARGDVNELRRLVASGCDPNRSDYDRRTALHLAASEGQMGAVDYLVSHGAAIDCRDRWNNTPLDDARRAGHTKIARFLEAQHSVDTHQSNKA